VSSLRSIAWHQVNIHSVNNSDKKYYFFLLAGLFLSLTNCSEQNPASTTSYTFEIDGRSRTFLLHLPDNLKNNAPLVFVIHGYGDSANGIRNFTKMDSIADKNGFAVCYPEATLGNDGLRSWNVGYSNYGVDDIGFINALASFLQNTYKLSVKNTFCTGMSNGGDMTIQMACLKPDLFRAVAPDVGCLMYWLYDSCRIKNIAPIFMINGTNDSTTFWEGDEDYPAIGPNGYMGTRQMVNIFVGLSNCMQVKIDTLPDINKDDGSFVIREKHINCTNNTQIWLYSIVGGGHDWPGVSGNMDFLASEEIWLFFKQFVD
jgi:polyhydroxybutyrate depolymerase